MILIGFSCFTCKYLCKIVFVAKCRGKNTFRLACAENLNQETWQRNKKIHQTLSMHHQCTLNILKNILKLISVFVLWIRWMVMTNAIFHWFHGSIALINTIIQGDMTGCSSLYMLLILKSKRINTVSLMLSKRNNT